MAQVSMQQVKELRERTQAGLNDCRSALLESEGDMDKAVDAILKKGLAKSAKRAGKIAAEGLVAVSVSDDGKSGVMAEVNIQTDFAARNPDFVKFVDDVIAAAKAADDGADLGAQPNPSGEGTLEGARQALVAKLGENITVRRWGRLSLDGTGVVHSYLHMGGKIGVLLSVSTGASEATDNADFKKFVDDAAMQIAAMAPQCLTGSEVPEADKAKQRDIFEGQLKEAEKAPPEQAWPKIIEGKLGKWMKEICLLDQPSVIETKKTVDQVRADVAKATGTDIGLVSFLRYERGEGIDTGPAEDFADEVAKMARGE